MSHPREETPLTCPSCTAPVRAVDTACGRCGQAVRMSADGRSLQAAGMACPRCNRPVLPGETYLAVSDAGATDACPNCGSALAPAPALDPQSFAEMAKRCLPTDLESLARAEAVDGWALLDTTVDTQQPGMILAHFRRSVHASSGSPEPRQARPAPSAAATAAAATARATDPGPAASAAAASTVTATATDPGPGSAAPQARPSEPAAAARGSAVAMALAWSTSPTRPHRVAASAARPFRSSTRRRTGGAATNPWRSAGGGVGFLLVAALVYAVAFFFTYGAQLAIGAAWLALSLVVEGGKTAVSTRSHRGSDWHRGRHASPRRRHHGNHRAALGGR